MKARAARQKVRREREGREKGRKGARKAGEDPLHSRAMYQDLHHHDSSPVVVEVLALFKCNVCSQAELITGWPE